MLTSIALENYRGFARYRVTGLSRVNLLVGKNNSGKSSLLEAVHLLGAGGDPRVLASTAWRRGEVIVTDTEEDRYRSDVSPDISHFFHGHQLGPGSEFRLTTEDGMGDLTVSIQHLAEVSDPQLELFKTKEATGSRPVFAVSIRSSLTQTGTEPIVIPVSEDGALLIDYPPYRRTLSLRDRKGVSSIQFISQDSLDSGSMSEMWNKVILDARESEVIEAVRILEPTLTNIFFLTGKGAFLPRGRAGIVAAFEGGERRVPLGSHGEGMRRLLALSLSLIQTRGGILLVDEIDTGLHYSVMGEMWHLVARAAQLSDVSVFATTHSFDCVRGLAWLCKSHPDLAPDVSLQKVERHLDQTVALDAPEIILAAERGLEVR